MRTVESASGAAKATAFPSSPPPRAHCGARAHSSDALRPASSHGRCERKLRKRGVRKAPRDHNRVHPARPLSTAGRAAARRWRGSRAEPEKRLAPSARPRGNSPQIALPSSDSGTSPCRLQQHTARRAPTRALWGAPRLPRKGEVAPRAERSCFPEHCRLHSAHQPGGRCAGRCALLRQACALAAAAAPAEPRPGRRVGAGIGTARPEERVAGSAPLLPLARLRPVPGPWLRPSHPAVPECCCLSCCAQAHRRGVQGRPLHAGRGNRAGLGEHCLLAAPAAFTAPHRRASVGAPAPARPPRPAAFRSSRGRHCAPLSTSSPPFTAAVPARTLPSMLLRRRLACRHSLATSQS